MNRTKKAAKNIVISLIGYFCVVISGFIARTVILQYMGIEIVGIGQLFSNIFMLLSYSSLGLETSIVYSLYAPLQQGDHEKVNVIMQFYKKCFRLVEIAIAALTVILFPLIPFIVKDSSAIQDIYIILVLYGLTAVSSYFYVYKRSIIVADQNRWVSTLFTDISSVLKLILQIVIISLTKSYILYMLTNIIVVISNMLAAYYADKKYPYLKVKTSTQLEDGEKRELIKTTKATIAQKLGFVAVYAADSVLMSAFLGLDVVGMYSNYLIVINGLQAGIIIIFQSVTAGLGDLAVAEGAGGEKLKQSWGILNFVAHWIYSFSAVCLIVLFNPFIELWIGKKYVFSFAVLICIVMNYYVEGMRKPVITCKDAMGIQWNDRWKPWLETGLNILLSLVFLKIGYGIEGILLGTVLSKLLSSCWIEPFVLYKYGLHEKIQKYLVEYIEQAAVTVVMTIITYICALRICNIENLFLAFGVKLIICMIVPNAIFAVIYCRSSALKDTLTAGKQILKKRK